MQNLKSREALIFFNILLLKNSTYVGLFTSYSLPLLKNSLVIVESSLSQLYDYICRYFNFQIYFEPSLIDDRFLIGSFRPIEKKIFPFQAGFRV